MSGRRMLWSCGKLAPGPLPVLWTVEEATILGEEV